MLVEHQGRRLEVRKEVVNTIRLGIGGGCMTLERFTAFVGLNLFQSALTRWCLMEDFLRKLGVR